LRASKSLYLYGGDTLSRERRFSTLVGEGRRFYLFERSWGEILEEMQFPSLFGRTFAGIRILSPREERVSKGDREIIKEIIKRGVVISSENEEKSELKTLLNSISCPVEYFKLPYERERAAMVTEELKRAGKSMDRNALVLLLKLAGDDTLNLWMEIQKLIYHPSSKITLEIVRELAVPMREYPVWELEIAIANRDPVRAGEVIESLKKKGEQPAMVVGSLNYIINRTCRKKMVKELFNLDWKIKMGYSPWDTIHLFVLRLMDLC